MTKTNGNHQVHDSRGIIVRGTFNVHFPVWVQGGKVIKENLITRHFRVFVIDGLYFQKRKIPLGFFGLTDLSGDGVAGSQVKSTDLRRGNVNIVRPRQIVVVGCAQKTKSIRKDFKGSFTIDLTIFFKLGLKQGKNEFLFSQAGSPVNVKFFGHLSQFADSFVFKFGYVH